MWMAPAHAGLPKGVFCWQLPWGDPERRGGGKGWPVLSRTWGCSRERDAGLSRAQPWLQESFCTGLEEVHTAREQTPGKQEGEDTSWFSSWRWKKKR